MNEAEILFRELKGMKDRFVGYAIEKLDPDADLMHTDYEKEHHLLQKLLSDDEAKAAYATVVNDMIEGIMHSILVMLDGGTALTDEFNIDIINYDTKKSLKEDIALHEEFIGYLLDNE